MSLLLEMFTYPFIVRAFVVGILVSLCAALLGVPLVLKRYSMIGDGLSHVSFGALSIAVACGWAPLPVSIPVVILAALGLLRLTERSRMGADAAIAAVSASSLAAGVIVTSLTTGMTTDVDSYMFGSILAMDRADVALSAGLSAAVLLLFVLFYHKLFAITFDESFSRATGVRVGLYNTFLSVLTALTIVLGMRMMGAMLISSLVIFPALSAMRVKELSGCGDPGGHPGGGLLLRGAYRVVPAQHPGGRHGGHCGPGSVSDLLRHRENKNNIRPSGPDVVFSDVHIPVIPPQDVPEEGDGQNDVGGDPGHGVRRAQGVKRQRICLGADDASGHGGGKGQAHGDPGHQLRRTGPSTNRDRPMPWTQLRTTKMKPRNRYMA